MKHYIFRTVPTPIIINFFTVHTAMYMSYNLRAGSDRHLRGPQVTSYLHRRPSHLPVVFCEVLPSSLTYR